MKGPLFLLPLVLFSSCSPQVTGPYEPVEGGIELQVLVGPTCPNLPFQEALTVIDSSGRQVVQFRTDAHGRYRAYLEAGQYILHPEMPDGMRLPYSAEQNFIVEPFKFTRIVVQS